MIPCAGRLPQPAMSMPKARANRECGGVLEPELRVTRARRLQIVRDSSGRRAPPPFLPRRDRRSARCAGSSRPAIRSKSRSHGAGRCTTTRASSNTRPNRTAAEVTIADSERPPTSACAGNDGAASLTAMKPNDEPVEDALDADGGDGRSKNAPAPAARPRSARRTRRHAPATGCSP